MPATNLPGGIGITENTKDNDIESLVNRFGWKLQSTTFTPKLVASTAAQDTGIASPANGFPLAAGVRIATPESTGLTKTLSVGFVGAASNNLINAVPVSSAATVNGASVTATFSTGGNLSYSLGSADFADLDCEVFVVWVCCDG